MEKAVGGAQGSRKNSTSKEYISEMIGKKIEEERRRRSLSQEALAFEANMHPSYLGCIERGEKCPTVDTLFKISAALGVPLKDLIDVSPKTSAAEPNSAALSRINSAAAALPYEKQEQLAAIVESIARLID